jgi:hypothetical protein
MTRWRQSRTPRGYRQLQAEDEGLDAGMVGAPGLDGLFDLFGGEVFAEGAIEERGELGVGGEAKGDDLVEGEGVGAGEVGGGEQLGVAKALFEADDAVLNGERVGTGAADGEDEGDGDDDEPEMEGAIGGPGADGDDDGDDDVDEEDEGGGDEDGLDADVVVEVLMFGHGGMIQGSTGRG